MNEKQTLTNSRASRFRACRRKDRICSEFGLRPEKTGAPLRIGSAFHAALDAYEKGLNVDEVMNANVDDPFDLAIVAAMYHGYRERYKDQSIETVKSEIEFSLPLRNPETGSASLVWLLGGKLDRIVKGADGRLALLETKTTSHDFSPGADYWLRLHMDTQLSIYTVAARRMGYPVVTILYDVARRPLQRPQKATPGDVRKYKKDGTLYASQRDRDETPEEFTTRISEDIRSRPDHYYSRIEIPRLDRELAECEAEMWQQQLDIRMAQKTGRWYRNPGACHEYGRSCEYLNICLNRDLDRVTPPGFVRSENIHPELAGIATSEG